MWNFQNESITDEEDNANSNLTLFASMVDYFPLSFSYFVHCKKSKLRIFKVLQTDIRQWSHGGRVDIANMNTQKLNND